MASRSAERELVGVENQRSQRMGRPPSARTAAFGALAIGALAFGATAIGACAIGRLAIRALAVKHGRAASVVIDELTVGRLRVRELLVERD